MDWDFKQGDYCTSDKCAKLPDLWQPAYENTHTEQPAYVPYPKTECTCICGPSDANPNCAWPNCFVPEEKAASAPKGEIPEEISQWIKDEWINRQLWTGNEFEKFKNGAVAMYRRTQEEIEMWKTDNELFEATIAALRLDNSSLTQQREERDYALVCFRKELSEMTVKRDEAINNIQKLIDDLSAKSDEAVAYRLLLGLICKNEVLDWRIEAAELLAQY